MDNKEISPEVILNFFSVSDDGLARISASEIFENTGAEASVEGCISFFKTNYGSALKFCYSAQSIRRCCILLSRFEVSERLEEASRQIEQALRSVDFSFLANKSFMVECERIGAQEYHSVDIAKEIAHSIQLLTHCRIDFRNPEYRLYAIVQRDLCVLGIDLGGIDLSRRDYRIFNHPGSLKGTIAYAMFRSGLEACANTEKLSVANIFCKSGELAIETALFLSRTSPNFFRKDSLAFWQYFGLDRKQVQKIIEDADSKIGNSADFEIFASDSEMRHISMARKNARIAGVERFISFSRNDLEWLFLKFGRSSLDLIISDLGAGKHSDFQAILNAFFKQANIILEPEGALCISLRDFEALENTAPKFGFNIVQHLTCFQGQQRIDFYILKRASTTLS
ncbi:MAG: THUMP domain-containing protein [Candidatus Woesearchaeota archaeon]